MGGDIHEESLLCVMSFDVLTNGGFVTVFRGSDEDIHDFCGAFGYDCDQSFLRRFSTLIKNTLGVFQYCRSTSHIYS